MAATVRRQEKGFLSAWQRSLAHYALAFGRLFALSRAAWLIVGIVTLGLVVRVYGISFGLPLLYEPGEAAVIRPAAGMLQQSILSGSWQSPEQFVNPTAYKFAQWGGSVISFFLHAMRGVWSAPDNIPSADLWRFYLVGRLITALVGTATVVLVYRIGKTLADEPTGILAALALALSPLHVSLSHVILPHVPGVFLALLSFWFVCRTLERANGRDYVLAGLFGGLAMATQYRLAVTLIPLAVSYLYRWRGGNRGHLGRYVLLGGGSILVGFFLGCPYPLLDWAYYSQNLSMQAVELRSLAGTTPGEWIGALKPEGIGLWILMLAGLAGGLVSRQRRDVLLLSFPMGYLLLWGNYLKDWPRDFLPVIPFLLILGAAFVRRALILPDTRSDWTRKAAWAAVMGVVFISSAYPIVEADLTLQGKTSTQRLAQDWLLTNVPRLNRVVYESYAPDLRAYSRTSFSAKLGSEHPLSWYRDGGWNIMVLSGRGSLSGLSAAQRQLAEALRRSLGQEGKLLREWRPVLGQPGPLIQVYSLIPILESGTVLFQDDFRGTDERRWQVEDGVWTVVNGRYRAEGAKIPRNLVTNPTFADQDRNRVPDGWGIDPLLVTGVKDDTLTFRGRGDNDVLYSPSLLVGRGTYSLSYQIAVQATDLQLFVQYDAYDADGKLLRCCNTLDTLVSMISADRRYEIKSSRFPPETAYIRIVFKWWNAGLNAEGTGSLRNVVFSHQAVNNIAIANIPDAERQAWDDYRCETEITLAGDKDQAGIAFHLLDPTNFYFVDLDAATQTVQLGKVEDGQAISLRAVPALLRAKQPYAVDIQMKDQSLEVVLDGRPLLTIVDSTFAAGGVGLRIGEESVAEFTGVRVIYEP